MNVVLIIPVVVAIIGLAVFLYVPEGPHHKIGEAGRLAYFAGLLVAVLVFAQAAVRIG